MSNYEKLAEMYRQLSTTNSPYKKRDLHKGIKRLELEIKRDKTKMKQVGDNTYFFIGKE